VALAAAIAAVLLAPASNSEAASPPAGLECLSSASNVFTLTASGGYISTPDGNSIYMWSYGPSGGAFQLPGPTLCVDSGAAVTVVLHNSLPEPTSLIFPGQAQVLADGRPAQPETDATGNLTSLTTSAAANTGAVTYTFTAGAPGTYLYQSGTDVQKQQQMGLYGGLVVRPAGHHDQENANADSVFDAGHEYRTCIWRWSGGAASTTRSSGPGTSSSTGAACPTRSRPTTPRGCPASRTAR
jgi:FtsP/CotA-like multicopper oxidase with cupredoxin domain